MSRRNLCKVVPLEMLINLILKAECYTYLSSLNSPLCIITLFQKHWFQSFNFTANSKHFGVQKKWW